ncbi:MAG: hypothetical protein AAFO74_03530 [Pseudomonadota bacterium]
MAGLPGMSSLGLQRGHSHALKFQWVRPGSLQIAWQVWAVWVAVFALYSAFLPRDAGYDIAHYHLQNGWSALHGRLDQDLAPADFHSFVNPVHSMLVWSLIERLPGPIVMALLSPIHAFILPVLYALGARVLERLEINLDPLVLMLVAATGYLALGNTLMHASVGNDHWGVLAFLIALVLLIGERGQGPTWKNLALGSLILGAAVGMKVTNSVYVPGYAIAVMVLSPSWTDRFKASAICAGAGVLGIALLGGWWAWTMWEMFGNPVYPNLSVAFGSSPLSPDEAFRDERYLPVNIFDLFARPFFFSFDTSLIYEFALVDLRFLVGYLAVAFALGWMARTALRGAAWPKGTRLVAALSAGFLASFVVWSELFSIMRYANALWIIGPLLALLITLWAVPRLAQSPRLVLISLAACLALVFTTSQSPSRRVVWTAWDEPYVWTELPSEADIAGAAILFSAHYPTAFNAPALRDAAWFTHADSQAWSKPGLKNYRPQIAARLAAHQGPVYAVMFWGQSSDADDLHRMASDYGYTARPEACLRLRTSFDLDAMHWALCPLVPASDAPVMDQSDTVS